MGFKCENCGWSKVVGSPIFCEYSEKRTFRENCCEAWKPKNNPVTNADKYFRNATDEELAHLIAADWCELLNCVRKGRRCDQQCETRILDWLKQEVESDA